MIVTRDAAGRVTVITRCVQCGCEVQIPYREISRLLMKPMRKFQNDDALVNLVKERPEWTTGALFEEAESRGLLNGITARRFTGILGQLGREGRLDVKVISRGRYGRTKIIKPKKVETEGVRAKQ